MHTITMSSPIVETMIKQKDDNSKQWQGKAHIYGKVPPNIVSNH